MKAQGILLGTLGDPLVYTNIHNVEPKISYAKLGDPSCC